MTIDALSLAPKLDTVVLITGDGDYVPLVQALKVHGCRVEVVSFDRSTAGELIAAADQYIPIQDNWIFKEKKFEAGPEGSTPAPSGIASSSHQSTDWDEQQPVSNVSARGDLARKS
jgi:hypothetical protein